MDTVCLLSTLTLTTASHLPQTTQTLPRVAAVAAVAARQVTLEVLAPVLGREVLLERAVPTV
jgi:hypothetical protein